MRIITLPPFVPHLCVSVCVYACFHFCPLTGIDRILAEDHFEQTPLFLLNSLYSSQFSVR